jgi:hypothetical protein
MSANFWCWLPVLGLLPGSPDFLHRVEGIQESPAQSPSTVIVEFVGGLLKRYPELSERQINTAWADGPLLGDASGQFIDIGIQWSRYEEAVPFVVLTAQQFGLNCYDPQNSHFYPMKNKN